jgi:hypothetical protein
VHAAVNYGQALYVAFDLHRFDMGRGLHYSPPSREHARAFNCELSAFLRGEMGDVSYPYAHPDTPALNRPRPQPARTVRSRRAAWPDLLLVLAGLKSACRVATFSFGASASILLVPSRGLASLSAGSHGMTVRTRATDEARNEEGRT